MEYMQKLFGVNESNVPIYQDILKPAFFSFLTAQGASRKTQKNYWSDVAAFISWFIAATSPSINQQNNHPGLLLQALLPNHINDYLQYQLQQKISTATINRRLSSLRIFFNCALEMTWLSYHPMEGIANIKMGHPDGPSTHIALLKQFEEHLKNQQIGKATIKNYLSDVRQFLRWKHTAYGSE
ncbi:hypothetical protein A2875_04025 [Candidatus Gottesmanbacteria bacterium RIFCSPHIGHO2_01_FULL_46_14]|uniref:Core-binding (CB) domain-containing protein n=1 Tax=Candidatus Gottesmanbacteria bacterium RIFCSPHIGHO2_01_FULL_46_14 TaxID=1798380 RepID=A0A1F5ZMK8_9BACT|nr:MAG: hypothetical protein A2875_04025 [Candidatus Gottesmanbacteria bacterium RIFCSPHIGHO2_01_FULL_46_14]